MRFETPEGATPIEDAEGLIPAIATMGDLNAVEAENILHALGRHLARRKNPDCSWLGEAYLLRLHKDMFGEVWEWAGTYRDRELSIGVAPHQVREQVAMLLGDFRYWHADASMSVLERAARLHHKLVWIHPFRNGNGRHARMLADVYLNSQGHPLPQWPADLAAAGAARARYRAALKSADGGDYAPLVALSESLL